EFGPARGFAQGAAAWADRNPGVGIDDDLLDGDDEDVAAFCSFEKDGAADRIGERRNAIEAGTLAGHGLVAGLFEEPGAGVVGFDLEALAGLHAQQGRVLGVEGVLAGLLAFDALHE